MNTQQKTYTATHRARLKEAGGIRIESKIHRGNLDYAREMAHRKGWPLWKLIEQALIAYLRADQAEQAARQRQANAPRIVGPIG